MTQVEKLKGEAILAAYAYDQIVKALQKEGCLVGHTQALALDICEQQLALIEDPIQPLRNAS